MSWAARRCNPAAGVGVGVGAGVGAGVVAGGWRRRWCSQLLIGLHLGNRHFHLGGGHRLIVRLHLLIGAPGNQPPLGGGQFLIGRLLLRIFQIQESPNLDGL